MNFPTPLYNAFLCQDLVALQNEAIRKQGFDANPHFKDAFMLLKIWLRQRKLCEVFSRFSPFLLFVRKHLTYSFFSPGTWIIQWIHAEHVLDLSSKKEETQSVHE